MPIESENPWKVKEVKSEEGENKFFHFKEMYRNQ